MEHEKDLPHDAGSIGKPAGSRESGSPVAAPVPKGKGERILVVEDDHSFRLGVQRTLVALGYHATAAPGLATAAQLSSEPGYDLLLSDLILEDGTGVEVAIMARKRWPNIAVIIMTGHRKDMLERHRVSDLTPHVLAKPFNMAGLASKLREVLDIG